ncbi:MAG: phosphopantetheine-binding protein [Thermodesulfobacteriota bacterium]
MTGFRQEEDEGRDRLVPELKTRIIDTLSLLDVVPEDIDPDARLVGDGLGIDSIDVLELVLMLEKEYGVKIETKEAGISAFASVRALADFVRENRIK